jgi:hypothetical protein
MTGRKRQTDWGIEDLAGGLEEKIQPAFNWAAVVFP